MKSYNEIDRNELLRGPDGELYEVIGFIDRPAVILHRVKDGAEKVIIPSAPIANEWIEVSASETQAELLGVIREHRSNTSFHKVR